MSAPHASRRSLGAALAAGLVALLLAPVLPAGVAKAGIGRAGPSTAPASTTAAQTGSTTSSSGADCRLYGSSGGFGVLCSTGGAGVPLVVLLGNAGIDFREIDEFCWDDPELPEGFEPPYPTTGPGAWFLLTCLSFEGSVTRSNARLSYEYVFRAPGDEDLLTPEQEVAVSLVTGRGRLPFLQVGTSPLTSPRVGSPVAFGVLCDARVVCSEGSSRKEVRTPRLQVAGVEMWAELVHLSVLPEGPSRPGDRVGCTGGGLRRTAAELDQPAAGDPEGVCRHVYERSSEERGGGAGGDRYEVQATAYWQVWYVGGDGVPQRLGLPYPKVTQQALRVTEVQTLVVS